MKNKIILLLMIIISVSMTTLYAASHSIQNVNVSGVNNRDVPGQEPDARH